MHYSIKLYTVHISTCKIVLTYIKEGIDHNMATCQGVVIETNVNNNCQLTIYLLWYFIMSHMEISWHLFYIMHNITMI